MLDGPALDIVFEGGEAVAVIVTDGEDEDVFLKEVTALVNAVVHVLAFLVIVPNRVDCAEVQTIKGSIVATSHNLTYLYTDEN